MTRPVSFLHLLCLIGMVCCLSTDTVCDTYTPVTPDPMLETWRWQIYDDLKGHGLRCVEPGTRGDVWFGVDRGIRHYDGLTWKEYGLDAGLDGGPVNTIRKSTDGSILAATDGGIFRFEQDRWHRIFPPSGHATWNVQSLYQGDGVIWAGTAWGAVELGSDQSVVYTGARMAAALARVQPDVQTRVIPAESIPSRRLVPGIGARIIEGMAPYDAIVWHVEPGGPADRAGLNIGDRIMLVDGDPTVLQNRLDGPSATRVELLVSHAAGDTSTVVLTRQKTTGTVQDCAVSDVLQDAEGAIWLGLSSRLEGGEILRRMEADGIVSWRLFTDADGLAVGYRTKLQVARNGHIWSGSFADDRGVSVFDGQRWRSIKLPGPRQTVACIAERPDGTMWFGSMQAIYAFDGETWTTYRPPAAPLFPARVLSIASTEDGYVWISGRGQAAIRIDLSADRWSTLAGLRYCTTTDDGAEWFVDYLDAVIRRSHDGWTRYDARDGLVERPVGVKLLGSDVYAYGTHNGQTALSKFDGAEWDTQVYPGFAKGPDRRSVHLDSNGAIWIGAATTSDPGMSGGALRVTGKTVTHFSRYSQVPAAIYGIGETRDGRLWLGGAGLRSYDGTVWKSVTEPAEFTREGLNWIDAVHSTSSGDLWVGTRSYGILRYNGSNWTRFTVEDGVIDNAVLAIGSNDTNVWAGTNRGISRFDGRTWTTRAIPGDPSPLLPGGLTVTGKGDVWINLRGETALRYRAPREAPETAFTINLDSIEGFGPTIVTWTGVDPWRRTPRPNLQYSWRVDDADWSAYTHDTGAQLPSLDSGTHTIQVRARDADFNTDPTPATMTFQVLPPVWLQPWFILLMLVLTGGIGAQTARVVLRDRRLQIANTELSSAIEEISLQTARKSAFLASMSHELRTPMNAIKGFTNLVLRRTEDTLPERHRENLVKVSQAADHLTEIINDILDLSKIEAGRMDVNVSEFNLAELASSCCDTVSPMVGADVELRCEVDPGVSTVETDEARVRQILVNLLSNGLKFTEAGTVTLSVSQRDHILHLVVSDTGQGIAPENLETIFEEYGQVKGTRSTVQPGTGLGLPITRKFAELLGGSIEAESAVGAGSTFRVRLPARLDHTGQ